MSKNRRTQFHIICLLVGVFLISCSDESEKGAVDSGASDSDTDTDADSDTDTDSDSFPSGIFSVDGLDASLPMDDLAPLGDMIGDAEVVALGESIHTSGGFYRAKHRVFKYLVEEKGFRAFGFESPWTVADLVADYVESDCSGGAEDPVKEGLFTVWGASQVADLVEWMCQYNQGNPSDPVGFFGFDIQQPWDDGPTLMGFISLVAGGSAAALNDGLIRCNGASFSSVWEYHQTADADVIEESDHQACIQALAEAEAYFDTNETAIVASTSSAQLEWARIALVGLRAWQNEMYNVNTDIEASYTARDEGMAYVLQKMRELRYPGEKVAVWAHNWHIALDATKFEDPLEVSTPNMGWFLVEELGDDYFPIGLVGYEVEYDWPGMGVGYLGSSIGSVVRMLHDLEEEYLLVDLAFPGAESPFLDPGESYNIDTAHSLAIPAELYRALFYLDHSEPMDFLGMPETN